MKRRVEGFEVELERSTALDSERQSLDQGAFVHRPGRLPADSHAAIRQAPSGGERRCSPLPARPEQRRTGPPRCRPAPGAGRCGGTASSGRRDNPACNWHRRRPGCGGRRPHGPGRSNRRRSWWEGGLGTNAASRAGVCRRYASAVPARPGAGRRSPSRLRLGCSLDHTDCSGHPPRPAAAGQGGPGPGAWRHGGRAPPRVPPEGGHAGRTGRPPCPG